MDRDLEHFHLPLLYIVQFQTLFGLFHPQRETNPMLSGTHQNICHTFCDRINNSAPSSISRYPATETPSQTPAPG
jgi:hypothetical protein